MNDTIDRLLSAVNDHDLDSLAALFHPDYDSRQPVHPARAFVGRSQVRANWAAMLAGVKDFDARAHRVAEDAGATWCEWTWSGAGADDRPFQMRGVAIFEINDGLIRAGSLYMEEVDGGEIGIEQAVEEPLGSPPGGCLQDR